jgi:hypothetical protein
MQLAVFEPIILTTDLLLGLYATGIGKLLLEVTPLPILDPGDRRAWVVSATPRPHCPRERNPAAILQEV